MASSNLLRILCLGDAHFEKKNAKEVKIFLTRLEQYLTTNNVDVIVIMGDTLHTHGDLCTPPLNRAVEYVKLTAHHAQTYVLVGNHDAMSNAIFLTSDDHWLNCLKGLNNVSVIDNVHINTIKGHKLVFCPYVPDGRFLEALNTRKGEWEDAECVFSHVTIKGANMGSIIAKEADMWDEKFPLLISGHIHLSQWLGPNMYYTGSIMQVAADEPPEKHITLLTLDETINNWKNKIKEIDLHLPKKKIINVNLDEIDDYIIPSEPDTKYSIYLHGSDEQFKAFSKSAKFKELKKLSQVMKIDHKISSKEKHERLQTIEELKQNKHKYFAELLREHVYSEKDHLLESFYKHLLMGNVEDITEKMENYLFIQPNPNQS